MKSIRRRLLLWLLPGLGLLWGAAGLILFQSVERGLELQLDSDLRNLIGPARFIARAQSAGVAQPQVSGSDHAAFNDPVGRVYFVAWRGADVVARSKSLGEQSLPSPLRFTSAGEFCDLDLANGDRVRTLAIRAPNPPFGRPGGPEGPWGREEFMPDKPGRPGPPPGDEYQRGRQFRPGREGGGEFGPGREHFDLVVGKSRRRIDETMKLVMGGVGLAGVVAAIASTLLVRFALESGLRPLRKLGDQTDGIDIGALDQRFPISELPLELRPIGDRLNDLLARLQAGFERERRFGADLAHELRTPVAELRSMAEVAMKWPEQAGPENYRDLQAIAVRMQGTIENLLRLARLENGAAIPDREAVCLADLVAECWKPFASIGEARQLRVRFEVAADSSIEAVPELLRTIISNLLSNAAEYAAVGSEVTVVGGAGGTMLSVSNEARQLADEDISHLFERLWRLDQSRTSGGHSGLGLALARACAEAMGLCLAATLEQGRLRIVLQRARL